MPDKHDAGAAPASFNLVDEPWIRVRLAAGGAAELSLREVLARAGEIAALSNDLPTQDFAILRVLLAVLQRSLSPGIDPEEDDPAGIWFGLWDAPELPLDKIDLYLDEWHGRFDLFDPEKPFMQVPGLRTASGEVGEVGKAIADVPDGHPFFTMRSGEGLSALTCAEAARWLVHLQAFDPSGIKSGAVGDPAAKGGKSYPIGTGWAGQLGGVYLEGRDLRETLLLNLVLWRGSENPDMFSDDDLPAWERPVPGPGGTDRQPSGYADVYTWQSRHVLLHEAGGAVDGLVLTNGDRLSAQNRQGVEPMTAWKRSAALEKKAGGQQVYLPLRHQSGRALWRGLDAVLPTRVREGRDSLLYAPGVVDWANYLWGYPRGSADGQAPLGYPLLHVRAAGFVYGTQSSVYEELIDDRLDMSAFLVSPEGRDADELVRECLEETDGAVGALGILARNLDAAAGDAGDKGAPTPGAADAARRRAYFEVDGAFRGWLAAIGEGTDLSAARDAWRSAARRTLLSIRDDLVEEAGPAAHVGREVKGGGWMTAGRADAIFRKAIRKYLPEREEPDGGR